MMCNIIRNIFLGTLFLLLAIRIVNGNNEVSQSSPLPLDDIHIFTKIFAQIKSDYVDTVDDQELIENAIRGMLEGLDPHSTYLDKDSYTDLKENTSGRFGGLGIEVTMENGFLKVIAPIDDTPAARARIKSGDLIIKLDDQAVKGMSLNDAIKIMRGKPNSTITLTIIRENQNKPLILNIVRDIIEVKSVKFETLEPGFGYLRVSNFQEQTVTDIHHAIDKLKEENKYFIKGIVLDLRNNPGGILDAAVGTADIFIQKGLIVYTEGRIKDSKLKFNAKPNAKLSDIPLVVLVNAGSASAAEIVAGTIQDHGRGIIMGEQTFGKGSVQTVLPVSKDTALKLTTARYYTPNGRSIQASGITPDIILDQVNVSKIESNAYSHITEIDLPRHMDNTQLEEAISEEDNEQTETVEIPLSTKDYALYSALNVLKGIAILQKNE